MSFYHPLDQTARNWFATGYRLRVKDIDSGRTLTDRFGNQSYVIERTTDAAGNHTLRTREGGCEHVQSFGPYDTVDACVVSTEADQVEITKVFAEAKAAKTAKPASRFSDDDFFVWNVEVHNHNGDFAGVRTSKGHVEDPDQRGRTLCGRLIPEHAITNDDWYSGNRCKHCSRLAGLD